MTGVNRVSSVLRAITASVALAFITSSAANALDGRVRQDADMHIGPSADFPIVGTVPADTVILINGCTAGESYCAVRHDGRHGWISSASVDLTGITRATNRMANSVVVMDLSDQLAMSDPNGYYGYHDGSGVVVDIPNPGNLPIVRITPRRQYGLDRRYYSSSSDVYLNGSHYYDRRAAKTYDYLMSRLNRYDSGLVNPRTRRYRSFVGRNDKNIRPDLRFGRFDREDVSTKKKKKKKRPCRRRCGGDRDHD